jgi:hypothetical protein
LIQRREIGMKKLILVISVLLLSVNIATAFEINGFKSGMTMDQAKSILEKHWCGSIEDRGNRIVAYPKLMNDPMLVLHFKKGSLYRYQKRCLPEFAYFAQLVADTRKELGRPVDAWFEPTNITSSNDINCFEFLWKNGKYNCRLSYSQRDPNSWMTITYEDRI